MTCAIVIPAYNAAAYIAEAIESALGQRTPAVSVAVVDDGSIDATCEICERYGDAVTLVRQENRGVSLARQTGAAAVTAEWLLFLDADDRLQPCALQRLLARAVEGEFGVVYGQTTYFDEKTGERRIHGTAKCEGRPPAGAVANFWKSAIATPGAAVIRSAVFREIGGFDPAVNSLADRDFWMKCGALAEFAFVPESVIEKREHGENMSGNLDRAFYQAAFVQLGFFDWCAGRGINPAFLQASPAAVIDNALRKSLETRSLDGAAKVVELADARGIDSSMLAEARRYVGMPRGAARFRLRLRAGLQSVARLFTS